MHKKTVREQAKIQGLSDQNQRELDSIEAEKQQRTKEFEATKKGACVEFPCVLLGVRICSNITLNRSLFRQHSCIPPCLDPTHPLRRLEGPHP